MRSKDKYLTDTTCYKSEKEKKNVSIHMHDTLKTKCEEKKLKKKKKKKKKRQQ